MQSTDWSVLPVHERALAEGIFDEIQEYAEDIRTGASRIDNRFAKLQRRIQTMIESGSIAPMNDGIKQLLAPPPEESEAENNDPDHKE